MGLFLILLLIASGFLTAREFIVGIWPAIRPSLDKTEAYAEPIGIIDLLIGVIWFLVGLGQLRHFQLHPEITTLTLISAFLLLTLGLMLGLGLLHRYLNTPTPGFLLKADRVRDALMPHRREIGWTAIIIGLLDLILYFVK